ncbi:MAG TPA: autotransporter-associated beta strand repeat-containing protein [Verrucomicrobiae bacterium]
MSPAAKQFSVPIVASRKRPSWLLRIWLLQISIALLHLGNPAGAGTLYWDTDGSLAGNDALTGVNLGGSGTWSVGEADWWNTSSGTLQAWVDDNDAVFCGTAGTVTASAVAAKSLTFKANGYEIGAGTLTIRSLPSNFTVDSGVTATISSTIAGTNTLVKLGAGMLILANTNNINTANTVAGGWRIEGGGTLRASADGSLGAPLSDTARNTVTDIQLNQSTFQAGASFAVNINRRTKINTNASTNRGDAIIDTHGNVLWWYGSLQGGSGTLRVINSGPSPGLLILGTDKIASINPFGSALPAGTVNLTVQDGAIVQSSGTVTPTGGELGSETGAGSAVLAIKLDSGQIRSESGGYFFQRNLILGPGGGSLDTGAWDQTFTGTVSGSGALSKEGTGTLVLDNSSAAWTGGTKIHSGTLQLGRGGSNGLLPGTLGNPSVVAVSAGATLKFNRGSNKSYFDIISGAGAVTVANSPTAKVRLVSNNTYTGPTTISSGILMIGQGNPGEPGSIASTIVNNNGSLVFNRVEDLTYTGAISGSGTVEKQAAGKLSLTGVHTYTGPTTVSAGTLLVKGEIGLGSVIVTNATLGGNGLIRGPVTIQSTGRLSPGVSIGTLTISNSLSLSGVTLMELDATLGTNDLVQGLRTLTYGGTLILANLGRTINASDSFKLFSAESYSGAFTVLNPPNPGSGLVWNTNTLALDGTLRVSSTVSTVPVNITNALSGNVLSLSWPPDHIGWRLQAQTNAITVGLGTNWVDVPNSTATNQITFTPDPAAGSAFYRLTYP